MRKVNFAAPDSPPTPSFSVGFSFLGNRTRVRHLNFKLDSPHVRPSEVLWRRNRERAFNPDANVRNLRVSALEGQKTGSVVIEGETRPKRYAATNLVP